MLCVKFDFATESVPQAAAYYKKVSSLLLAIYLHIQGPALRVRRTRVPIRACVSSSGRASAATAA